MSLSGGIYNGTTIQSAWQIFTSSVTSSLKATMLYKKIKWSDSKNMRLVLLLNGFQVVRMVKLLRTFGMCGLYQKGIGEIGVDDCNSFATVEKMVI